MGSLLRPGRRLALAAVIAGEGVFTLSVEGGTRVTSYYDWAAAKHAAPAKLADCAPRDRGRV